MPSFHSISFAIFLGTAHALALVTPKANPPSANLVTKFPSPNTDPFYHPPKDISHFSPGDVIRSRAVSTLVLGETVASYQVYYRTTDAQNEAVGTVATIYVPALPASPPKIFSFQVAEDSLDLVCSPSYSLVNGSAYLAENAENGVSVTQFALSRGWYVVAADNLGPDSAYLVGPMEGHATLDGIRTTIKYLCLDSSSTDVALFGYSGAAHMTVWASSLAATYAPELAIIGAAYGGTPIDPHATFDWINGEYFAGQAGGALLGFAKGYPRINSIINRLLTANGTKLAEKMSSPDNCLLATLPEYACINYTLQFTSDPDSNKEFTHISNIESLLSNVSTIPVPVPTFPRFQWHGTNDSTIPYYVAAAYVEQQCAKGADIRFLTLPGLNHEPNYYSGLPGALQFLDQAFKKELGSAKCGANVSVPAIGSNDSIALLGVSTNYALAAFYEEQTKAALMIAKCPH